MTKTNKQTNKIHYKDTVCKFKYILNALVPCTLASGTELNTSERHSVKNDYATPPMPANIKLGNQTIFVYPTWYIQEFHEYVPWLMLSLLQNLSCHSTLCLITRGSYVSCMTPAIRNDHLPCRQYYVSMLHTHIKTKVFVQSVYYRPGPICKRKFVKWLNWSDCLEVYCNLLVDTLDIAA